MDRKHNPYKSWWIATKISKSNAFFFRCWMLKVGFPKWILLKIYPLVNVAT